MGYYSIFSASPIVLNVTPSALHLKIMHEFWMSGDNNGRWAGSYSDPLDHQLYLAAAADTVSRLRGHPSLLFWCGGNELYPAGSSPPPDIAGEKGEAKEGRECTLSEFSVYRQGGYFQPFILYLPAFLSPLLVGLAVMVGAGQSISHVYPDGSITGVRASSLIDLSRRPFVLSSATNYTDPINGSHPFDPALALAPSDGP